MYIYIYVYVYYYIIFIETTVSMYIKIERVHDPDFMPAHRHHSKCSKEIWITCKSKKSYLLEYLNPIQAINNHILQQYPICEP